MRNLFDLDNARYLNTKELVETFIPTQSYMRLLAPKNQIIIGSRGSGKTALLRMISHEHLAMSPHHVAQDIVQNKTYIGVHISTKTKFIGGLKNKEWQTDEQKEKYFRWLMNVASCVALLDTLKSCLNAYYQKPSDQLSKELEIVQKIRGYWFCESDPIYTIDDIAEKLEDIIVAKGRLILRQRIYGTDVNENIGEAFDLELFEPLVSAINVINRKMNFPASTAWFICIDEIEILESFHHRILNSYMRANMGNVFFKFTTLPYCHYTLETNVNVPLDVRHDFQYVYIDQDKSFTHTGINSNALKLFKKRAQLSKPEYARFNLQELFGRSMLLDYRRISYEKIKEFDSQVLSDDELNVLIKSDETLQLFVKHANETTLKKGIELLRNKNYKDFGDQVGRKMKGLLVLKEYLQNIRGNQNVVLYSGERVVVALGDANPRKLLTIFNEMFLQFEKTTNVNKRILQEEKGKEPIIPYNVQNEVLATVAEKEIARFRIEKNFGTGLFDFVNAVGQFMGEFIMKNKLSTEQISSIEYNEKNASNLQWEIIERAVQKGLVYPNINIHNTDEMPFREGHFRLAFILAPRFKILPRKGDSREVSTIINSKQLTLKFDA